MGNVSDWSEELQKLYERFQNCEKGAVLYKVLLWKTKIHRTLREKLAIKKRTGEIEINYRKKCERANDEAAPLILGDGMTKYCFFISHINIQI